MIEVAAIPILMKAVDFLFEEGSKILQERRERRKAELGAKLDDVGTSQPAGGAVTEVTDVAEAANILQSKEAALNTSVNETVWKASESEMKHLLSLLEIYTKNYYLAKEQHAKFGSALVPPVIVHNLTEAEDGIADTIEKLQTILNKVYGKKIIVPEAEEV